MTNRGQDRRVLQIQALVCAAVVLGVALWPPGPLPKLLQAAASGLGSLAVIVPSMAFSWWSSLQTEAGAPQTTVESEEAQRRAQRVLGLAGLRLIGSMTLMVIAFTLMSAQALWVLIGVVAAAIGQVVAVATTATQRRSRR
ncbi:MAG: hypothetical protein ACR2PZ_02365 [Pseudomonadales bacterium]